MLSQNYAVVAGRVSTVVAEILSVLRLIRCCDTYISQF
jgi:hypothetical protein